MKCIYCKKEIEDWAFDNKDADGNEYCMNCQSKIIAFAEMEEIEGEKNTQCPKGHERGAR